MSAGLLPRELPRTRSCPRFRPGSKPEAAVPLVEASRGLSFIVLSNARRRNKGICGFTTSRPPPGREDAQQGRDEEIGDVAAYVIDQANGGKWDD